MNTVDALLKKGVAARPDLREEMDAAAVIVRDGRIRLTSPTSAIIEQYDIHNGRCTCANHKKWCLHRIAERMARALNQPIDPLTEAEKEQRSEKRARRHQERKTIGLSQRGENRWQRWQRQKYKDGEGARAYIRMATANGATSIPDHIYQRATGNTMPPNKHNHE